MLETSHSDAPLEKPELLLKKNLDKTRELFVYLLFFITEIARYTEAYAQYRRSKNLPSQEDLSVSIKLAGNLTVWSILENPDYQFSVKKDKPENKMDADLLRKLFLQLVETTQYQQYIIEASRDKSKDRDLIKFLFSQVLLPNELFCLHIEEWFPNWDDDSEMLEQLVMNYLHNPGVYNTKEMVSEEKWLFARDLLNTTLKIGMRIVSQFWI
ncbi:MAG: hypothetical protein EBX50_12835 [Chitinophagia bacterium]|nr:hypothetical protein [Chitinophagia bacterium]